MKVGVGSYAYRWAVRWRRMDVFALLDRSHEAGAEVVQICDNLPLDSLSRRELADLAWHGAELGLTLEVGIRGSQPEHLHRSLDVAEQLGARLLRVALADAGWEPSLEEIAGVFRALLPKLHVLGITVAIENHFRLLPSELVSLIQHVDDPLVGICLDPLNSITRLVGPAETVATLAPFAVSVHVKDAVSTRLNTGFYIAGCPLGEGLVDVPGMLAALRAAGRSPNLLVECWMDRLEDEEVTLMQEQAWVRQGIAYLRQLLDEDLPTR
ncbi:MAG TPA: sugar phosphate isomerase/epimerase [Anaerolineae bacterium]|nr:sugar phosphate isomerase/epimerase [Anaerolineae bacterium]HIQ04170.1 sugar phosphate isomerase/epimerase [Anaerolineae bacterium]